MPADEAAATRSARLPSAAGTFAVLSIATALVSYKASASLAAYAKARSTATMSPKTPLLDSTGFSIALRPFADAANYLGWVVIALMFGIVLGAAVKSLLPRRLLEKSLGAGGLRAQMTAAVVGAPLMLCSCCAAPVFEGIYSRSRRIGPALGLMLASPALNPAALALTFLLFPLRLGLIRLLASLLLVLGAAAGLGRLASTARPQAAADSVIDRERANLGGVVRDFGMALRDGVLRTLPAIVVGVVLSAALAAQVPLFSLSRVPGGAALAVIAGAALALPMAMPTFAEIPVGLALLAAGADESVVAAVLIAGPAINLPSLFTVARTVSARAALATGTAVFVVACISGLAAGLLAA